MIRVSVIIPTYNRPTLLKSAIDSVLEQTFKDFELIVVDDNSDTPTANVINEYNDSRLHFIEHDENRGGAAARNTGIGVADGEYIAFLDDDDEWLPPKLKHQIECLDATNNNVIGAYSDFITANQNRNDLELDGETSCCDCSSNYIRDILRLDSSLGGTSSFIIERESLDSVNGFDEKMPRHQELEMLLRVLRGNNTLVYVDEPLVVRNMNTGLPPASDVTKSKNRLFEKHTDLINEYEHYKGEIKKIHNFRMATMYFKENKYREGVKLLFNSKPKSIPGVLAMVRSLIPD